MGKSVLVTLANTKYVPMAKQLFSSAYFHGGWPGDYLLLADHISEKDLSWFRKKGILVKKCESFNKKIRLIDDVNRTGYWQEWLETAANKLYLFDVYFKKWENVLFLDGDIIVKAKISDLAKVKGFNVALDGVTNFGHHFRPVYELSKYDVKRLGPLRKKYNFSGHAFNSGVMAFSTEIIKGNTFSNLRKLLRQCQRLEFLGDQTVLNVYFYKRWRRLPAIYNGFVPITIQSVKMKPAIIHAIIMVPEHRKFWHKDSPFYLEWKHNLDISNKIDLKNRPKPVVNFSKIEILWHSMIISWYVNRHVFLREIGVIKFRLRQKLDQKRDKIKNFLYRKQQNLRKYYVIVDRNLGVVGLFINNHWPWLYRLIKKFKK